jgi:hypothetical protein
LAKESLKAKIPQWGTENQECNGQITEILMIDPIKKCDFIDYLTEVQNNILLFRKELRTGNLDEWNAKAQLVFTAAHMDAVKQNLKRSMK